MKVEHKYAILFLLARGRVLDEDTLALLSGYTLESGYKKLRELKNEGFIDSRRFVLKDASVRAYWGKQKALTLINYNLKPYRINLGTLEHELFVGKILLWLNVQKNISPDDVILERDVFSALKFQKNVIHRPDIILMGQDLVCIEYDRTQKSKKRMSLNLNSNFATYKKVLWIYREESTKNLLLELSENKPYQDRLVLISDTEIEQEIQGIKKIKGFSFSEESGVIKTKEREEYIKKYIK